MAKMVRLEITWKNDSVAPPFFAPNCTGHSFPSMPQSFKSSTLSILDDLFSITKNAAKLAVYDETIISVKNHQTEEATRIDAALKMQNSTKIIKRIKWFTNCRFLKMLLWFNFGALLKDCTCCKPHGIVERKLVFQKCWLFYARIPIFPLWRWYTTQAKEA